jgi:uracil-DNA glycosylase
VVDASDEDRELEALRRAGLDRLPSLTLQPQVRSSRRDEAESAAARPSPAPPRIEPPPQVSASPAPTFEVPVPVHPVRPVAEPPATVLPPPAPARSLFDVEEAESPPIPAEERPALLAALAAEVAVCARCPHLAATRTQTVFGVGVPTARLMFVGEAPGADEDRQGEPFVGRAGMLLTDMITKGMGLTRESVYIANVLKSRPPENRNPELDEIANCLPYLERQIEIIRPEFLCLLGRIASGSLLNTALPLSRLRGRWHRYKGIPTIVTYHPSYLLRNPADKKKAWDDLQMLMKAMGLTPPGRR